MSPVAAIKGMSDAAQIVAIVGSVAVGAFGFGVGVGAKPELEPMIERNTVAIDSLRVRADSTEKMLVNMARDVKMLSCVTREQLTSGRPVACLP